MYRLGVVRRHISPLIWPRIACGDSSIEGTLARHDLPDRHDQLMRFRRGRTQPIVLQDPWVRPVALGRFGITS